MKSNKALKKGIYVLISHLNSGAWYSHKQDAKSEIFNAIADEEIIFDQVLSKSMDQLEKSTSIYNFSDFNDFF